MRRFFFLLCFYLSLSAGYAAASPDETDENRLFRIVSYNVENLFHPNLDSLNPDTDFTPDGKYHWTYSKYRCKVQHIAQVITNIGQFDGVDIVGLCEVENEQCVSDLCSILRRFDYRYIHFDSPDKRGIDVALLYRPTFRLLTAYPIPVPLSEDETTRDILYASGTYHYTDTLHLFLCHLPSQSGGTAATAWKREAAVAVLQQHIDSIFSLSPKAQIVVMGDMNTAPEENIRGLHNAMLRLPKHSDSTQGTHKYKGRWSFLDQFYLSDSLLYITDVQVYSAPYLLEDDLRYLDTKPRRTYIGYRYQTGYSDHLPIRLTIKYKTDCQK